MNRGLLAFFIAIITSLLPDDMLAQLIPVDEQKEFTDSLKHDLQFGPYFGLYKDNYFTVGTTPFRKPTSTNSDVKFQISLSIRLTNAVLPWNSFLFLFYTQKTFWNVFQNSMPMHDLNFNPGIGWSKPFFNKGRYAGKLTMLVEHESNGRDGLDSRSWNRVSFYGSTIIDDWLMVHAKFWIPIIDGENNRDILKYCGIYQSGVVVTTPNKKFSFGLTMVKRSGWNLNFNTILEASWKVHEKSNLNLFAQYYNGYGESLLDYNQFHSRLRVGIVFKPHFFSEF
ncbi:phospholipase A [Lepagella muris]|jgi:phospholipase A1|uniref:Phospholipase n=1 Tax=Lepagella muris TaxID=3032870 RepID=A0AC61RDR2_9BACT|nr:phospholipase A [Lepagella muris]ROT05244.1 phospholipase [Muribaculaceae bacterium Isolate-037 (Harlan)]TGY77754.1 phospholipase [Lepagella muris]THG50704.1 phospholipase [Bacteroidales bacterium]TKC56100.1 phospholipase [Bacteroidales bacterium]